MRHLRPEYYSDTADRATYALDAKTLEYCLETITERKETEAFELFCRKLCQRTICPNLRPQSGPDGGGDSKADTETFPVAPEITIFFIGEPDSGRERWAFAFSAKKTWAEKVNSDVKGIVETGRPYDRIICVTSRFAKAKNRAQLEQDLSAQYAIPVTIYDRSWIVAQIIEEDRKDIAFNYLGVGQTKGDPLNLGPTDYSRTRQLADIEKSFDDPDAYIGMERQSVTEGLIAAKLARNLERSRSETDSRFLRAIRLANKHGSLHQRLEAYYEHLWTAYWWFDDVGLVNDSYDAFQQLALPSKHSRDLEFVCNLWQLLVNSVMHELISREDAAFDRRTIALSEALAAISSDSARPNNSLEAQTSLAIVKMNRAFMAQDEEALSAVWTEFSSLLDKARGLGEFDLGRLEKMIDVAGDAAGNDPSYNSLIERLAAFIGSRKSEAEGAIVLLRRAQKLNFDDHFDMIRMLGKAAIGLTKREYNDHLIDALSLLTLAYRSAGLFWAARATSILLAASIVVEGEQEGQLPAEIVPTMKVWAWHALSLKHVPDCLYAIKMLRGALHGLPFTDESKEKISKDILELDLALGHLFLNMDDAELLRFKRLPDLLERLELFTSRTALLFTMGHLDTLRADGSIPEQETDASVLKLFSKLASQPLSERQPNNVITNEDAPQKRATTILGMDVEIEADGSADLVILAELLLGALEVFFATAIEHRVTPHTERLQIKIVAGNAASQPKFEIDELSMSATVTWPTDLSPTDFKRRADIRYFLMEATGLAFGATCVIEDADALLKKLFDSEAVHHRLEMIMAVTNSYHRVVGGFFLRLNDMLDESYETFAIRLPRPTLEVAGEPPGRAEKEPDPFDNEDLPIKNHRDLSVRSVIDFHAWEQARWRGTAFAHYAPGSPPALAFAFENESAARAIFQRWRDRFGDQDTHDEIYVGIVRRLSSGAPHHYNVVLSSKTPDPSTSTKHKTFVFGTKWMTMDVASSENLDRFLAAYASVRTYYLMPALLASRGPPRFLSELALRKSTLSVKNAADIAENDIESITLLPRKRA